MRIYNFKQFKELNLPKPEPICPGLVNRGDIVLMSAKPKTFKSITARNLAYQMSVGGQFLGKKCKKVKVLYLALEENPFSIRGHLEMIGVSQSNENFLTAWVLETNNPALEIAKAVEKEGIEVIFVDTLIRAFNIDDINCYVETNKLFKEKLAPLRDKFNLAMIFIHHAGKNSNEGSDYLGSTGLFASVDNLISLKKKDGEIVLNTKPRANEPIVDLIVPIDIETLKVSELKSKSCSTKDRISENILCYVKENPNCTLDSIKSDVKGRAADIGNELKKLVESSKLIQNSNERKSTYTFPNSTSIDMEYGNNSKIQGDKNA